MNYMNVLSDFEIRLNKYSPDSNEQVIISDLENLVKDRDAKIEQQAAEITRLTKKNGRIKGQSRQGGKKAASTSLKDLARKLMKESTRQKDIKETLSKNAKPKSKAVRKATPKKTTAKKTTAKKTTAKRAVRTTKKAGK